MIRHHAIAGALLACVAAGCASSKREVKAPVPPVTARPAPRAPSPPAPPAAVDEAPPSFASIHFDFDRAIIRAEDAPTLESVGGYLATGTERRIVIAGHTDERGTVEYNVARGD